MLKAERSNHIFFIHLVIGVIILVGCANPLDDNYASSGIYRANLMKGPTLDFDKIRDLFRKHNPGYDINYQHDVRMLDSKNFPRILFIQKGGGTLVLSELTSSKFSIGDLVMIPIGIELRTDSFFSGLIFQVPEEWPRELPMVIRPDWDNRITDVPGGCATETNAYRRILLTWKSDVGPYIYQHLNAHRVRITNSFTHYHPLVDGFDEFYLVQMVRPNARLITSSHLNLISNPEDVTPEQVDTLLHSTPLKLDDLIYIPRGVIHRGMDSVLAQVITIPGFIPGAEIGVDHHIHKINQRLNLVESSRLPLNEAAADTVIIR